MDHRTERVQRLTKDILDLFQADPGAYIQCPNCSHRIGLIVAASDRSEAVRRGRRRRAAVAVAVAARKPRKTPKIGPVLKLVRQMASQQRVVTGKIFKAMNSSIGNVSGLAKPEIRKRQLVWLKAHMKTTAPRGRGKGKKAA